MRAILICLFAATLAKAQCPPGVVCPAPGQPHASATSTDPLPQAARVRHATTNGASLGTATLIAHTGNHSYWVTCRHLFDDGRGKTSLEHRGGRIPARIYRVDPANDLAVLVSEKASMQPVEYSDQAAGSLSAGGFGQAGSWRAIQGGVLCQATRSGATAPSVVLAGQVRRGDSGGPVLDARGRLVGVVWGAGPGRTYATCGRPLKRILSGLVGGPHENPEPPLRPVPRAPERIALDGEPGGDWPAWRRETQSQLELIERRVDNYALRDELQNNKEESRTLVAKISDRVQALGSRVERAAGAAATVAKWTGRDLAIGGLSLGGPIAAALLLGKVVAWRRASRSVKRAGFPVAIDAPPLPQRVVPETHYVPYERDEFARAHQWAGEQLARKYPGSVEWLSGLDSLIKQHLAGDREHQPGGPNAS